LSSDSLGQAGHGGLQTRGLQEEFSKSQCDSLDGNDGISSRIAELRAQQSAKSEFSRDQLRQFLIHVITAKPEQASMQNPLCEIAMTKKGPAPVFPDKLGAAVQLAKLTGWNSVEKVSIEAGDTLSAFLRQIIAK
jgi:hypothetical protein